MADVKKFISLDNMQEFVDLIEKSLVHFGICKKAGSDSTKAIEELYPALRNITSGTQLLVKFENENTNANPVIAVTCGDGSSHTNAVVTLGGKMNEAQKNVLNGYCHLVYDGISSNWVVVASAANVKFFLIIFTSS